LTFGSAPVNLVFLHAYPRARFHALRSRYTIRQDGPYDVRPISNRRLFRICWHQRGVIS